MGSYEDFWWDITAEIDKLGIKKKFDQQLKKMSHQDKHRYKDTRGRWAYALAKVKKNMKKEDFNGGWTSGEAAHHIGKKLTQQTIPDKTKYNRKKKHKKKDDES